LVDARFSIGYPRASATDDHELVFLIGRSLVVALAASREPASLVSAARHPRTVERSARYPAMPGNVGSQNEIAR
jgi:hypothetical protein